MDTLQIAYKILHSLETGKKADYMGKIIGPQALDVPEDKWLEVLKTLRDEGYISGVRISKDIVGDLRVDIKEAHITMKGAEYLHENSAMQKIAKVATDVIKVAADTVPTFLK